MADLNEDKWLRDVSLMIAGWMIGLFAAGLLLIFVGSALFG